MKNKSFLYTALFVTLFSSGSLGQGITYLPRNFDFPGKATDQHPILEENYLSADHDFDSILNLADLVKTKIWDAADRGDVTGGDLERLDFLNAEPTYGWNPKHGEMKKFPPRTVFPPQSDEQRKLEAARATLTASNGGKIYINLRRVQASKNVVRDRLFFVVTGVKNSICKKMGEIEDADLQILPDNHKIAIDEKGYSKCVKNEDGTLIAMFNILFRSKVDNGEWGLESRYVAQPPHFPFQKK